MIEFTLKDTETTQTYQWYETPFTDKENGGEEIITTMDGNVYVDFIYTKRTWERTFAWMREEDYLTLKGFVDRQRQLYKFPTLSIPAFNVNDVPVYMQISDRQTIDGCGTVQDVTITMRETVQQ